ncbi:MAG: hypothetical protein EXS01_06100 [Phycisphaerales bacterium]|nr:hypothetical protein [Phycisphaerales bacterium]
MRHIFAITLTTILIAGCGDDTAPSPSIVQETPAVTKSVVTKPTANPPAKPVATKPPAQSAALPAEETKPAQPAAEAASAPVALAPEPPKTPAKRNATASTVPADSTPSTPSVPIADVDPALQKYATMAATPKFKDFIKLAEARQLLQVRASNLRFSMRGRESTPAEVAELASLAAEVGKVGDRMDSWVSGKNLTQDELVTMDYIIGEQMRLHPPG